MANIGKFKNILLDTFPEEKSDKKESKMLRPGLYNDVPIVNVEAKGPSDSDPTWEKFTVSLEIKGKERFHFLQVPTGSLLFGDKKTDMPFRKLQGFCKAIGIELNRDNVSIVLDAVFSEPRKLIGLKVDVVLAHDGYYGSPENGKIIVRSKDDKPLLSEDGVNPISFTDFEAVKLYCADKNLQYSYLPGVKFINPPKTANDSKLVDKLLVSGESKKKAVSPF